MFSGGVRLIALCLLLWPLAASAIDYPQCVLLLRHLADESKAGRALPSGLRLESTGETFHLVPHAIHPGTPDKLIKNRFVDIANTTWYDPNSIYVGISNHPSEGDFHFYLMAGDLRLDGAYGKTALRRGNNGKPPYATQGLIFKIQSDPKTVERVHASMLAKLGTSQPNCLKPVLDVLTENGIGIQAVYPDTGYTSATAAAGNLLLGAVSRGPTWLPVKMLATSEDDLKKFLRLAPQIDVLLRPSLFRAAP